MGWDISIDRYLVRLRLTRPARFHFQHGGALRGLVGAALRLHALPPGLIPFACESGTVRYQAGDYYNLGITLLEDSRSFAPALEDGLRRAGSEKQTPGPLPALGGNFELVSMDPVPPPDLRAQAEAIHGKERLTLRFLSPFRLERPKELRAAHAGYLNRECFPPGHFFFRLWNRIFSLTHGGRFPSQEERAAMCPPWVNLGNASASDLLWLDIPVKGRDGKNEAMPKGYTLGGVIGTVVLDGFPSDWIDTLVAGQYTHAGENSSFGMGRFSLLDCPVPGDDPFRPAKTCLSRISDPELLDEALGHVLTHSDMAGDDGVSPEEFTSDRQRRIADLSEDLRKGKYQPSTLLGFVIPKKDGKLRALAAPTVRDRVAQRAACLTLGEAVETLLEDCSYAYRKGFSRAGAARAIREAYGQGYRYVLDADITSFFDSVEWDRLFGKLDALFPGEPLIEHVKAWVRARVRFRGTLISRTRGLPQGAAVSPLLANLFLDEFDEELLGKDFRLVRFADDFVVLCRSLDEAHEAKRAAESALKKLGLSLQMEKTSIRSVEDGFHYLGYLFCRSMVMESGQADPPVSSPYVGQDPVPQHSWLAQVPLEKVRLLTAEKKKAAGPPSVTVVPLVPPGTEPLSATRPLYVLSPGAEVSTRTDSLILSVDEGDVRQIPIRSLSHVVLVGKLKVTVPVLLKLGQFGIPVFFCRRSGELYNIVSPYAPDWPLWLAQGESVRNDSLRMEFCRAIVEAKLHNFAALSVRFKLKESDRIAADIRELENSVKNKSSVDSIRGVEGKGAALYFGAMRASLPDVWGFSGRRKNPPPDPVNSMLSMGYTMIHNHVSTALFAAGLHPRIGLYHEERGAYHALAYDLIEEFRHFADALAWSMVHRNEVKPSDFAASPDGRFPCHMTNEFRKKFVAAFEKRLVTVFSPEKGREMTYLEFMDRQARSVKDLVTGRILSYCPLRVHS